MAENVCNGVKTSESEFQNGLTASCGPNAAAAAARWADQSRSSPSTYAMFLRMRALGLGGPDGLSGLSELTTTLEKFDENGYIVLRPNAGESPLAFMNRMAGKAAVVWETANGQALRDYLTGYREDASNLQRHILCSWGTNSGGASALTPKTVPDGFWMSDGDSDSQNMRDGARYHWPINTRLVYYPADVVAHANPIDALAVLPRVVIPGGLQVGVPQGWKDDGKTLVAPNGVPVVRGFRDYVLNHGWAAGNYPLKPEVALDSVEPGNASVGAGSRQDFRLGSLGYTTSRGVYSIWVGQDIIALESQLAAANSHVSALESQLQQLQQQIDPKATEALAAVRELAKALSLLTAA